MAQGIQPEGFGLASAGVVVDVTDMEVGVLGRMHAAFAVSSIGFDEAALFVVDGVLHVGTVGVGVGQHFWIGPEGLLDFPTVVVVDVFFTYRAHGGTLHTATIRHADGRPCGIHIDGLHTLMPVVVGILCSTGAPVIVDQMSVLVSCLLACAAAEGVEGVDLHESAVGIEFRTSLGIQ